MSRALIWVVAAGLLAGCSGSDGTTSTSIEPPAITAAASTSTSSSTTTTSTTSTTTTAATTTSTTTTTEPVIVDVPEAVPGQVDVQALGRAAFVDYEVAWRARRDAVIDPSDQVLRDQIAEYYVPDEATRLFAFLDDYLAGDLVSSENLAAPNTIEFMRGEIAAGDNVVQIVACEVLAELETNRVTGEVLDEGTVAYTKEVLLERNDDRWRVVRESSRNIQRGVTTCAE